MLIQQLVNGLTLGAVYTLIALSFSLVMGILGVLNLAIAELFMLGGYFGFAVVLAQLPLPLALIAGMAGAALVAAVIETHRLPAVPHRARGHADAVDARLLDHPAKCRHQHLGFRSAATDRRGALPSASTSAR